MAGVRMWHWLAPLIACIAFCIFLADKPQPRRQRACTRSLIHPNISHSILFSAPKSLPPPALETAFERIAWLAASDADYENLGNRAVKATGESLYSINAMFHTHARDWCMVASVMEKFDWLQVIARNRTDARDIELEELAYVQGDHEVPLRAPKYWACHQPPYRSAWPLAALGTCLEYRAFWRTSLPRYELKRMRHDVVTLSEETQSLLENLHKHREDMQRYRVGLVNEIRNMARVYDIYHASYNPSYVQALRTRFLVSAMVSAQSAALLGFAHIALQLLEDTRRDLDLLRQDINRVAKHSGVPPADAIIATRQRISELRINGSYANTIRRLVDIFDDGIAILESPPNEAQAHPVWYEMSQFWKQSFDEEDASRARRCLYGVATGANDLEPDCLAVAECPVWKEWHVSKYPAERFWGDSLKTLQIGTRAPKKRQWRLR